MPCLTGPNTSTAHVEHPGIPMDRAGTTRQVQPSSSRLDKEGRRVEAVGEERAQPCKHHPVTASQLVLLHRPAAHTCKPTQLLRQPHCLATLGASLQEQAPSWGGGLLQAQLLSLVQ